MSYLIAIIAEFIIISGAILSAIGCLAILFILSGKPPTTNRGPR